MLPSAHCKDGVADYRVVGDSLSVMHKSGWTLSDVILGGPPASCVSAVGLLLRIRPKGLRSFEPQPLVFQGPCTHV